MKTKKMLFAILVLSALTLPAFAQEAQAGAVKVITIDEAVRVALDNNLGLRRSAVNLGTARRAADRSWNALLPSLNASAMVSHPTSISGPIPPGRDMWTPGFHMSAGITLSTATIENIRRARADYEAGLLSYGAAREQLEVQVRRLFYQILLLDASRELAAQSFGSARSRYEQTAALARVGQASRLDELSARVDMENLRPVMMNAEIAYVNALDSFRTVLGIPAETPISLDGNLATGITDDVSGLAANMGASIEVSMLLASIRSMEAQRNTVRNSAQVPSLRLSWDSTPLYIHDGSWNNGNWIDGSGSFTVSLGLSLDSFFPWSNARTQIAAINDNIRATEIQVAETLRDRENRVNQNVRTVVSILESLEAIELNVELAQSTYEMISDAFGTGAADYQRLRSAGDGLAQARHRLLQEQFNLAIALLDIERELNIPFGTLSGK